MGLYGAAVERGFVTAILGNPTSRKKLEALLAIRKPAYHGHQDNLFNLIQLQDGSKRFFGGCTGFGCGAAFNFVSLLPNGRVDVCRKFDSPIGNIFESRLLEIYESERARQYREGPSGCQDCTLRPVCRGCIAVMYGMDKDVFGAPDPYCFAAANQHR